MPADDEQLKQVALEAVSGWVVDSALSAAENNLPEGTVKGDLARIAVYIKASEVLEGIYRIIDDPSYPQEYKEAIVAITILGVAGRTSLGADIPGIYADFFDLINNVDDYDMGVETREEFFQKLETLFPDVFVLGPTGFLTPPGVSDPENYVPPNPMLDPNSLAPAYAPLPPNDGLIPSPVMKPADIQGGASQLVSPLVLDLDGDGVELTKLGYGPGASGVYFDLNSDGFAERTACPSRSSGRCLSNGFR